MVYIYGMNIQPYLANYFLGLCIYLTFIFPFMELVLDSGSVVDSHATARDRFMVRTE